MNKISTIIHELQQQFSQGRYAHLSKFHSVRELAAQYAIGLNSAHLVLQALEDLGHLTARPKSGFWVNAPTPAPSLPAAVLLLCANPLIKNRANQIRLWAESVSRDARVRFDLATASPDFYPTHALQTLHNRMARHHPAMLTEYAIGGGLPQLRDLVTQQYRAVGCALHADDVLITHGATQALMLALQATTQAGDWVLIEAPTYFGFLPLLDSLQLNAVEMPIDVTTGVQTADICAAIAHAQASGHRIKACLLQANFHNPTGTSMALNVRQEILEVCVTHEIAVIEDDTFGSLPHHGNRRAEPLKTLDAAHNVILCGSLSKLIAPGLRIGFIAGARWHESVKTLQHATAIACATLPQATLAEFMRTRHSAYLKKLRQTCAANIALASAIVREYFPHGTRISAPQGGYLLWLTLPATVNATKLLHRAMGHAQIAFAHGALFSNHPAHAQSLRLNCALMAQPEQQAGLRQLGELARNL
ncbi:MAG: PLP-dependent aminotransferase family protein [Formosimonas sp.]